VTYDASDDFAALVSPALSAQPEEARKAQAPTAPVDEWLVRRMHGFGASEMGALSIALGVRLWRDTDTKKLADDARLLFARKASTKLPRLTPAKAKKRARDREQERAVLDAWIRMGCPGVPLLDPSTVRHASEWPEEWMPLRDARCHRLTATPDAWMRDRLGALVEVSVKTTFEPYRDGGLLWNYERQSQAACAVTCAEYGVVLTGLGYARPDENERGGIVVDVVERDEATIAELREMVIEGWRRVEALKGGA